MKKLTIVLSFIILLILTHSGCHYDTYKSYLKNEDYFVSVPPRDTTEAYTVKRVVDGDTFIVLDDGNEVRVRMIGIDTPESVSSNKEKNCEYGKVASDFTKTQLEGKTVELEYDTDKTDTYGRTLAYVYVDDELFNSILIEKGYAVAREYPPNVKYSEVFTSAQVEAQKNKVGMWSDNVSEQECNLKSKYYIYH